MEEANITKDILLEAVGKLKCNYCRRFYLRDKLDVIALVCGHTACTTCSSKTCNTCQEKGGLLSTPFDLELEQLLEKAGELSKAKAARET